MKISEIKQLEASVKGFIVTGKVIAIYKSKEIKGTKNNKAYCFVSTSIKLEDDTGEIYVQFTDVKDDFKNGEGQIISCLNCSISDYEDKEGVMQRSLRARDYSFDVIPDTAQQELPKTTVIDDEDIIQCNDCGAFSAKDGKIKHCSNCKNKPKEESKTPILADKSKVPAIYKLSPREQEERDYWIAKDTKKALFIVRQHCETDAVSLVCKFSKGNYGDLVKQVKEITTELVAHVYQDLDYPIKDKTQDEKPEHTQKFVKEMEEATEQNVVSESATDIQEKALELKGKMFNLTGDDIAVCAKLENMYDVDNVIDLDTIQQAEFCGIMAKMIKELELPKSSAPQIDDEEAPF